MTALSLVVAIALLAADAPARGPRVPVSMPPNWAGHIVFQSLECPSPHKGFGRIVGHIATSPDGSEQTAPNVPVDKHLQRCLSSAGDAQSYRALQVRNFSAARALLIQHGVPFEPNNLLDSQWSPALIAALASMPKMHGDVRASHLKGAILADLSIWPSNSPSTPQPWSSRITSRSKASANACSTTGRTITSFPPRRQ